MNPLLLDFPEQFESERLLIRAPRVLRSAAVAERAGFVLEGVLRNDVRSIDGELRSTRVYAKIRG